jgi:hypothetical protein
MNEARKPEEIIDAALRRYLEAEGKTVDARAFLQHLRERGRRRHRVRRLTVRALPLAAAAALLLAAGVLLLGPVRPRRPSESAGGRGLLALESCGAALQEEALGAWRAACSAGGAAVRVAREPLGELPELGRADSALDGLLGGPATREPSESEENDP